MSPKSCSIAASLRSPQGSFVERSGCVRIGVDILWPAVKNAYCCSRKARYPDVPDNHVQGSVDDERSSERRILWLMARQFTNNMRLMLSPSLWVKSFSRTAIPWKGLDCISGDFARNVT